MINLLTAIQTVFNSTPALITTFPNGCYLAAAPDNAPLPICTLTNVATVNDYQTRGAAASRPYIEKATVQFSVYAVTDTVVLAALEGIATAFDFVPLTLGGSEHSLTARRSSGPIVARQDESVWMGYVVYEFWQQR